MKRHVVIVAGGRGVRMGADRPKQFLEIGGKPILRHTIERFLAFDPAIEIILVLPRDQRDYWRDYCRENGFLERYSMVSGGITRFHSVQNALEYVKSDGIVAVHDGVRPFASAELIRRTFDAAREHGAAIPVVPVVETVRQILPSLTGEGPGEGPAPSSLTVDRSLYRLVQTPQTFQLPLLLRAYEQPYTEAFTDDASVVEALGHPITLVEGNRENIKITTPFDLRIAEALLAK